VFASDDEQPCVTSPPRFDSVEQRHLDHERDEAAREQKDTKASARESSYARAYF
jgi:hypothetical protein